MPRKKMKIASKTKAKKSPAKRQVKQVKSAGLSLAESIEKDFRHVPARLAALYSKDLATLKIQETKLTASFKKIEAKQKAADAKCAALAKKTTPAAKKQLVKAKKALSAISVTVAKATAELLKVKMATKAMMQKKVKFIALGKELNKIEKELDLKAKEALKVKPKAKAKPKAKVKARKASAKKMDTTQGMSEQPLSQDHSADELVTDTAEFNS